MNKLKLIIPLFLGILIFSSCKKDGDVILQFYGEYNQQPLVVLDEYTLDNDQVITFLRSDLFISEITLLNDDGDETLLSDIELINFTDQNSDETRAKQGVGFTYNNIDFDDFTKIRFGLGVPAAMNSMQPEDFPADSPLTTGGFYWQAWNSFIFSKTEGKLDTDNDGNPDLAYVFHTGSDEVYQTVELDIASLSVKDNTLQIDIAIDHHNMMHPNGQVRDIESNPVIHSAGGFEILKDYLASVKTGIHIQ